MPLEPILLPDLDPTVTGTAAETFIREAESRIEAFRIARANRPIRHFIPSDYRAVYAALQYLAGGDLLTGANFCEWGSGFGVVTGLAVMEGLTATGIEIEPDLIAASKGLLQDFEIDCLLLTGSYLPTGYGLYYDSVGDSRQLVADGSSNPVYDREGIEVSDFDLVFVYPWPGEAQMVEDLFEATAVDGAILLIYQGHQDLQAYRQVG
ncbi:MAG: hypothetical protein H7A43_11060 [Verrucomicrobia bacterium]|nr:hypothetical protein [Verrucomicrobiota bacterium]